MEMITKRRKPKPNLIGNIYCKCFSRLEFFCYLRILIKLQYCLINNKYVFCSWVTIVQLCFFINTKGHLKSSLMRGILRVQYCFIITSYYILRLRTNFYFTRNLFNVDECYVDCSWVHGRVSRLLRCVPLGLLPGLLHASLHPPLVLAPVLLEQLRRHRVRRRVRVGVTQLNSWIMIRVKA